MTLEDAKKIGSQKGLISAGLGLLIAHLIMTAFISIDKGFAGAFFWFTDVEYKWNLFIGAVILLLSGHFYGQLAGQAILIAKRNSIVVGILCGVAVLLTTALLAGWTGFFQEGMDKIGSNDDPFEDYLFKPFFWITLFGTVPALIVGVWFGWQIKRRGRQGNASG